MHLLLQDIIISDNLVPELDQRTLDEIANQVSEQYNEDYESMNEWRVKYDKALKLAKMDSDKERRTRPFKGAAKVMMPYILEAAIDFNSRIVMEYLSRGEIVLANTYGRNDEEKEERAERVQEYANYQLNTKMKWPIKTDKEMMALPIVGTTYKKQWYCPITQKYHTDFIMPDEVIFSQEETCFEDAPQVAHRLYGIDKNHITSMVRAGLWEFDVDELDEDMEHEWCEVQFLYDIDGDGYDEPYIGILCKDKNELVRIVANFDPDDIIYDVDGEVVKIEPIRYITQKQLIPDPEGRPMGLGYGIMLSDMWETINTNIRQLLDAGTLANMAGNSGLIAHGVQPRGNQADRFQTGNVEMELGVFKQVQMSGGRSLRESVVQFPFAGPNATLFQLLQHLEDAARRMTVSAYNVEANPGEAASLYLARLQQSLKAPNAMLWRVSQGFKAEFECLFKLFYKYGDNDHYNRVIDAEQPANIQQDFDYETCDVEPALNASQGSDHERMMRAQAVHEAAQTAPQMYNMHEVNRRLLDAMNVDDIETVLPEPTGEPDPMQVMQLQYAQQEQQIQAREIAIKEQKAMLEQMKLAHEMRKEMAELELEVQNAGPERVKTLTEAMKNLSEIADIEERKALDMIQTLRGANDARQASTTQPGRSQTMAGGPGNASVPARTGMVPGAAGRGGPEPSVR